MVYGPITSIAKPATHPGWSSTTCPITKNSFSLVNHLESFLLDWHPSTCYQQHIILYGNCQVGSIPNRRS